MTWLECAVWEDFGICGYLTTSCREMELHFDAAHMRMPISDLRNHVEQHEDLRPVEHRKFQICVMQALWALEDGKLLKYKDYMWQARDHLKKFIQWQTVAKELVLQQPQMFEGELVYAVELLRPSGQRNKSSLRRLIVAST